MKGSRFQDSASKRRMENKEREETMKDVLPTGKQQANTLPTAFDRGYSLERFSNYNQDVSGGVNDVLDNQTGREELRFTPPTEEEVPTRDDFASWATAYETKFPGPGEENK